LKTQQHIENILRRFNSISLKELNEKSQLMNRMDDKYILPVNLLPGLLQKLGDKYQVLVPKNEYLNPYRTRYLDTKNFNMFLDHHNGKRSRYKVRLREYMISGTAFTEIKRKNNKNQTQKHRIPNENIDGKLTYNDWNFVHKKTPYHPKTLETKLWNRFYRITLVHKTQAERATIDLDINFECNGYQGELPFLSIVEVKQPQYAQISGFKRLLRDEHQVKKIRISKYCLGISMLYPNIKHNLFKPKFIILKKISDANNAIVPAS
jgi:hypothetical protein